MDTALYKEKLDWLFHRFPSVQKTDFSTAYKPGLGNMERFSSILGEPDRQYRTVHVAGTNGKGSVSNMIASALAASGLKVGLYTSPHIIDFRERMRIIDGRQGAKKAELITEEEAMSFILTYERVFIELNLSFFEITTGMAFRWFAARGVDCAVIETGLGGRLDSTNIIVPELSIITSIGLDHCDLLGDSRAKIAAEKAGIFKPGIPAVVASRDSETAPVFEERAAQTASRLVFADEYDCGQKRWYEQILAAMDLRGDCQRENLRTALVALEFLCPDAREVDWDAMRSGVEHTAERMDFRGRWQLVSQHPTVICDIAHNPPALKQNFARLERMLSDGECDSLVIVYGVMADKDLRGILPLMPKCADFVLVEPRSARSLAEEKLYSTVIDYRAAHHLEGQVIKAASVADGVEKALAMSSTDTVIYIGGSTFVVSEAFECLGV